MKFFSTMLVTLGLVLASSSFADSYSCRPIALNCFAQDPYAAMNVSIQGSSCLFTTQVTVSGNALGATFNSTNDWQGGMWSLESSGVAPLRFNNMSITVFYSGAYYADMAINGLSLRMGCNRYQ
jgi:hypothetical protein